MVLRQLFRTWIPRGRPPLGIGGGRGARCSGAVGAVRGRARSRNPCRPPTSVGASMTMAMRSCLYTGNVMHERSFPRRHRLSYGVWYVLADLDELPELDRIVPGF